MKEIEQHLLFKVIDQVFSVNVANVKSIIKLPKVYGVPQAPDFILGVINVEGDVIPLIDSGIKFNGEPIKTHDKSQLIILKNLEENESVSELAFLVNDVSDVVSLDPLKMQKLPTSQYKFEERFVEGMHSVNGEFCMQINVSNLFVNELSEIVNNNF
jgi:purine-binding chemotaxis protein CheW